jgi:hypothetical protein
MGSVMSTQYMFGYVTSPKHKESKTSSSPQERLQERLPMESQQLNLPHEMRGQ